ncbi:hypothetical protein APZ41_017625 [Roseomonas mucosa]|uniref:DUF1902 domain-containing protein n=1 Tax=Roseomonas mucosa TaxID=207340 RepID=A0A1S8D112_9PROT|nr:DUF1902 domain-containing protein [Roseomonas mucosa]ONH81881.1 hypothetical protein APZ41_017625 [Roseomonas mucosa]
MAKFYEVRAHWDPEAHVYSAVSDDVPGLAAEADTTEELFEYLEELVPELLELNVGPNYERAPIRLVVVREQEACHA